MMIMVVVIFGVCWMPYHAYFIVSHLVPQINYSVYIQVCPFLIPNSMLCKAHLRPVTKPEFEIFFFFANSSVWFIYFWYLLVAHIQIDLESLVLCKYPKKCQGCKKVLSCPDSVLRLTLSKPVIFELQQKYNI